MLQQLHCRDGAFALRAFANHPESRLGRFLSIRFDILAFGWSGVGDEISAMIFSCFLMEPCRALAFACTYPTYCLALTRDGGISCSRLLLSGLRSL